MNDARNALGSQRLLRGVALAAGGGAVALLGWRFGWRDLAHAFEHVRPIYLAAYVLCGCLVRGGYGLRWYLVTRRLGAAPPASRFVAARLSGDAVGSLLPGGRIGGDPLRAALVYGDGVGGTRAGAGVAIDRIMEMLGNTLCAIAYVSVFAVTHTFDAAPRAVPVLIGSLGALLVGLAVPLALLRRGIRPLEPFYRAIARAGPDRAPRWVAPLQRMEDHLIRFVANDPAACVWGVLGSLAIEALVIVEMRLLFTAFGVLVDLPTLLMALVATGLARAVPTPAGLGALEAGQVVVLGMAMGRPDIGFVAGILLRLHETWWTVVGFLCLSVRGVSMARLRLLVTPHKVPV